MFQITLVHYSSYSFEQIGYISTAIEMHGCRLYEERCLGVVTIEKEKNSHIHACPPAAARGGGGLEKGCGGDWRRRMEAQWRMEKREYGDAQPTRGLGFGVFIFFSWALVVKWAVKTKWQ